MKVTRTSLQDTKKSEEFELTDELLFNICKWNGGGDENVKGWLLAGKVVYTNFSMWRLAKES